MQRNIDFLAGNEDNGTPLWAALLGFQKSFKARMGIDKFPLVMHNDHKGAIKKAYKSDAYPYGYFRVTDIAMDTTMQIPKAIQRYASSTSFDEMTNSLVDQNYMFPCNLTIECFYYDNSPDTTMMFAQRLAIMNACRAFSFNVSIPSTQWWVDLVSSSESVPIPVVDIDDESKPMVSELTFGYTAKSKIGIVKSVPKINNEGKITTNVHIGKDSAN